MNKFGQRIRELREQKGLLQKHIASKLDIDTPMISKIERGERNAQKLQVILLSEILEIPQDDLMSLWLSDKIFDLIRNEGAALKALDVARDELINNGKQ